MMAKRQRNNEGSVVQAYWITEPDVLEVHPFSALLDAIATDNNLEASRLLALDNKTDLGISPQGLPTMTPPLIHAVWRGNDKVAELLLQRAASNSLTNVFDVGFGGNPLHWAAAAGRDGMLESFIARAGPSCVNDRSFEGLTPLHAAAGHGHTGCVRILLRHAADPNLVDLTQSGPLHEAAQWGHADSARALLGSKANPGSRNHRRETPLLLAARGGHTDIVEMLLDAGATHNCSNEAGVTPLLSASFFGHEPTVRLLQRRGADVRAVDAAKRRTALEWAVFNNHRKVVEALVGDQPGALEDLLLLATEGDAEDVLALFRAL